MTTTIAAMPSFLDPLTLLGYFGTWALVGLLVVIFIESGVLFPVLPGDTLLFVAGMLAAGTAAQAKRCKPTSICGSCWCSSPSQPSSAARWATGSAAASARRCSSRTPGPQAELPRRGSRLLRTARPVRDRAGAVRADRADACADHGRRGPDGLRGIHALQRHRRHRVGRRPGASRLRARPVRDNPEAAGADLHPHRPGVDRPAGLGVVQATQGSEIKVDGSAEASPSRLAVLEDALTATNRPQTAGETRPPSRVPAPRRVLAAPAADRPSGRRRAPEPRRGLRRRRGGRAPTRRRRRPSPCRRAPRANRSDPPRTRSDSSKP